MKTVYWLEPNKRKRKKVNYPDDSLIIRAIELLFPEDKLDEREIKIFIRCVKAEINKNDCCVIYNVNKKGVLSEFPYLDCGKREVEIFKRKGGKRNLWVLTFTPNYGRKPTMVPLE